MALPFRSLDKVITAIAAAAAKGPRTVPELHRATRLSEVQVRRALWRAIEQGFVQRGCPSRRKLPNASPDSRGHFQYELTQRGWNLSAARTACRGAQSAHVS